MRINRVHQAALRHGWYTMTLEEFRSLMVEDYGDRMEIVAGDGHRYSVANFLPDDDMVVLRRIA